MKRIAPPEVTEEEVDSAMAMWDSSSYAYAEALLIQQRQECLWFEDDEHLVQVRWTDKNGPIYNQAVIRRKDKEPIKDHWKVLQRIKNDVFGHWATAYEVYPPDAEVVDTANTYHLWVSRCKLFETYSKAEAKRLRGKEKGMEGQD